MQREDRSTTNYTDRPNVIEYRSYKHNYARSNNNCEIAGIAQGQKGMREGMETIRPTTLAVVKSSDAID